MAKNNKTVLTLTLLITASLVGVVAALVWIGYLLINSNSRPTTPVAGIASSTTNNSSSLAQVALTTARNVDYTQLRYYLQQKDWQAADQETYARMLDVAGPFVTGFGLYSSR